MPTYRKNRFFETFFGIFHDMRGFCSLNSDFPWIPIEFCDLKVLGNCYGWVFYCVPEFHTIPNIFMKIGFRNADKRQDNGVGFAKQCKKWRRFVRHWTDLIFHFALYTKSNSWIDGCKNKKARYFQISLRSHLWMNFKNSSHSTCCERSGAKRSELARELYLM